MSAVEKLGTAFGCAGCVFTDTLACLMEQERGSQV